MAETNTTKERKMGHRYLCGGPLIAEYILGEKVRWRLVAAALGMTETITKETVPEVKKLVEQRAAQGKRDRMGCGTDVTALMEAKPWDGQQYFVECPKCGNKCGVRHEDLGDDPE